MADFSFLDELQIDEAKTVEYVFYDLVGADKRKAVVLNVAPAGEPNKMYFAAFARWVIKQGKRATRGDIDVLAKTRDMDRALYADYVVQGWENMPGGPDNTPVPFSKANCKQFLEKLPNHMFDRLREFCADLENFSGLSQEALEETGKNSQSGSSGN